MFSISYTVFSFVHVYLTQPSENGESAGKSEKIENVRDFLSNIIKKKVVGKHHRHLSIGRKLMDECLIATSEEREVGCYQPLTERKCDTRVTNYPMEGGGGGDV